MSGKTNKARTFALITAICFALFAVYKIVDESAYMQSYNLLAKVVTILEIAGYIGLAAASFMQNRRVALIAAGVCLCVKVYVFAVNYSINFSFLPLAYAALLVIVLLSLQGKGMIRYIWYIPGLLLFFRWLYISRAYGFDMGSLFNANNWLGYLATILETITFLFAGLWLKEETTAETDQSAD